MTKKKNKKEHVVLDSSLPSEGHPMAAWPGSGHTRPIKDRSNKK